MERRRARASVSRVPAESWSQPSDDVVAVRERHRQRPFHDQPGVPSRGHRGKQFLSIASSGRKRCPRLSSRAGQRCARRHDPGPRRGGARLRRLLLGVQDLCCKLLRGLPVPSPAWSSRLRACSASTARRVWSPARSTWAFSTAPRNDSASEKPSGSAWAREIRRQERVFLAFRRSQRPHELVQGGVDCFPLGRLTAKPRQLEAVGLFLVLKARKLRGHFLQGRGRAPLPPPRQRPPPGPPARPRPARRKDSSRRRPGARTASPTPGFAPRPHRGRGLRAFRSSSSRACGGGRGLLRSRLRIGISRADLDLEVLVDEADSAGRRKAERAARARVPGASPGRSPPASGALPRNGRPR